MYILLVEIEYKDTKKKPDNRTKKELFKIQPLIVQ